MADDVAISVSVASPTAFWRVEGAELGAVIRARRKAHQLSIEGLASEAGMHPTYLSAIERGRCNPSWVKLSDLAEALEVPVSTIAREAEDQRIRQTVCATANSAYRTACVREGHGHGDIHR